MTNDNTQTRKAKQRKDKIIIRKRKYENRDNSRQNKIQNGKAEQMKNDHKKKRMQRQI